MHRAIKIFTVAGIPVKVHWTFIFMPLLIWYMAWVYHLNTTQTMWVSSAITVMLICILLHEFGHALAARKLNVSTSDILLLPIGGLARLENLPSKAIHELWIAIAGPAVNVLIALITIPYLVLVTAPRIASVEFLTPELILTDFDFLPPFIFAMNLGLAAFNLLPAFPMDGGRVVRALLAIRMGRYRATKIAAAIGQLIAVAMFAYGLLSWKIPYIFIAAFIFIAAQRERFWIWRQHLLSNKISDVFLLPESGEAELPIQQSGEFKLNPVQGAVSSEQPEIPSGWESIDYHSTLEVAVSRLYETKMPALLVKEEEQALGLISLDLIEEWLSTSQPRFYFLPSFNT
ncbi:MAG: hypothetical protein CMN32_11130 [Saprospirales bacterium]|nr:hypothetical protein [Saprospirales bacterium]